MDYIHYFDTETNHNSVYKSSAYTEPWVAYIEENKKCTYNKILQYLMGTATSTFKPTSGAFSGYTFTSPTFKVIYSGDTLTNLSVAFYTGKNGYNISGITESTLDTSKVTNMRYMFYGCRSLTDISGIKSWNTSNVTDMFEMFTYCTSLTTVDLSKWNTSNVTNMSNMFYGCKSLTTLDLSNWNITSGVTDMSNMFINCYSLTEVKVTKCSDETQNKILNQLKSDLTDYTWTLSNGVITRS